MATIKEFNLDLKESVKGNNTLTFSVYYDLGGYSMFTHKPQKRGYYVSVTPENLVNRGGFITRSTTFFSGYKYCLKEVARRSKKAEKEALGLAVEGAINILKQEDMAEYVQATGLSLDEIENKLKDFFEVKS